MKHPKLFIPGPTEVRPEVLAQCARPMIGHRGKECAELVGGIEKKLQALLHTPGPVFLLTASANGAMEACLANLVQERVLVGVAGAWGERFFEIARALGLQADKLEVPPGTAIKPEQVAEALSRARYDCVAIVHNETATGAVMPLKEIAAVVKSDPSRLFVVDAVSSMAAEPIDFAGWKLDACLAGLQKAFACPPGMSVIAVSPAALERAKAVAPRCFYFSFAQLAKSQQKQQTLSTPALSILFALDYQLDRILAEGMEARHRRHREMAEVARTWGAERFALFAEEGHRSVTVTTIANTCGIDVAATNQKLRERHGAIIGNGYGVLKDKTFRIGHMGDLTVAEIRELVGWLDEIVAGR